MHSDRRSYSHGSSEGPGGSGARCPKRKNGLTPMYTIQERTARTAIAVTGDRAASSMAYIVKLSRDGVGRQNNSTWKTKKLIEGQQAILCVV
jgi:hypothetical protein